MKKSLVMASLIAASTSMMAMDLQYFLGAGVERADTNIKISNNAGRNDSDNEASSDLKLKLGVILDKTHRTSLSHINYGIEGGGDFRIILANYDYLIPINNEFRLYTGLHAGNANMKINDFGMSGLAYGAQVGAIYDITKNVEFELGLGYTKYNIDRAEDANYDRAELENSTSMFAGINYKF